MLGWPWGGCTTCLVLQERPCYSVARRAVCWQHPAAVLAEHPSTLKPRHVLARQTRALTEHGGGWQPGRFYPVRGFTVGSLCSGTPTDVLVKTSSDLHHGLRHSQLDSASFHLFVHKCQISIPAPSCSLSLYVSQVITSPHALAPNSIRVPASCWTQTATHSYYGYGYLNLQSIYIQCATFQKRQTAILALTSEYGLKSQPCAAEHH